MKKIILILLLITLTGCFKNWHDPQENFCAGFRVKIGPMGKTESAEQLSFLLKRRMTQYGFNITDQGEQAVLTGITTVDSDQLAYVTAQLTTIQGVELWNGYFKPRSRGNSRASSLELRAADINKSLLKSCTPEWRK